MNAAVMAGIVAVSWIAAAQPASGGISTPPVLPAGFTGAAYAQTLYYQGGPYSGWQLTSGTLPDGLALSPDGLISGTPTTPGTATFVVTLTLPSLSVSTSQTFSLTIVAGPPHLVITPSALPAGSVGSTYSQNLATSGGTAPHVWTLTSGTLPSGLSLCTYYDNISGAPSSGVAILCGTLSAGAVTSTFTVRVTDASSATVSQTLTLPVTLVISPTGLFLPSGMVGMPYSGTFTVAGGAGAPYTWSTTSALPPGLTLSTAGVLSGTPTSYGTWTLSITVADAAATTSSQTFTLTINPAPLAISTASTLPSGVAGTPYAQTLTAAGGVPPYTWQLASGSLPPLLSLSTSGVISGTPTTPGSLGFTISVADSALHAASQTFTLIINTGPLTISSPATLPSAVAGIAYSQTLTVTGGVPPYTWQVVSGSWPAGLSMSSAGVITGTPTTAGSYAFGAKVTDSASETATQTFALTVAAAGTLARVGVISQTAAGGGWDSTIWLVNRSSASVQASIVFRGDDGSALTLPLTVTQPGFSQQVSASSVQETIAPNSMLTVATGAAASSVQGWADVLTSGTVSGFAVFRYAGGSEAAALLESQLGTSISLPFDNTGGYSTGVALANLSGFQANITATVWDQYGNRIVTQQPITLSKTDPSGNGHDAFMLTDRLSVTAGTRGIVQFQSNPLTPSGPVGQLAGLGLRAGPTGAFTSLPTITP